MINDARTWVEIDRDALLHNLVAIRVAIGSHPEIMAIVKADAYGHGALVVAETIAEAVDYFGVACIEEALPLLSFGLTVVLLSPCLPSERAEVVARGVIVTVSSAAEAQAFADYGAVRVNLKIDTGMGRIGCLLETAETEVRTILADPRISLYSIATHLSAADADSDFTIAQIQTFARLRTRIAPLSPLTKWHSLNSAGVFLHGHAAGDIVRTGLALYGSASPSDFQEKLRPVLTWKSRVVLVRDLPAGHTISYGHTHALVRPTRTAVVSVGYADGFLRSASGKAQVLIAGCRCPVLGRVTMDQIIVDATAVSHIEVGDEVVLIGKQGSEEILAGELATHANTISWEIFTSIHGRTKRIY